MGRKRKFLKGKGIISILPTKKVIAIRENEPEPDPHEGDTEGPSWWEEGRVNWQNYLDNIR